MKILRNTEKSIDERVKYLLTRMTLEEKVAQLCAVLPHSLLNNGEVSEEKLKKYLKNGLGRIPQFPMPFYKSAKQIAEAYNKIQHFAVEKTRLGIPIMAQVECLNGVVAVDATSFPSPIAIASTWEPELAKAVGYVVGRQMRVIVNGANALAPVVDLARDARWGRVSETYGESAYVNSAFGTAAVKGIQFDNDLKKGVQACAKHFLGYSYSQGGLNSAPIEIGFRELYEAFARPFETMIHEASLQSVMCTYSEIDGKPVSVSPEILRDLLRDRMGFEGSAICDGGSIERACTTQHTAIDMKEAGIMALVAGLDADAPRSKAFPELVDAVKEGLVEEKYVDEACARALKQKFILGLFDNPYVDISRLENGISTGEDEKLSLEITRKSIILLKNEGNLLPLNKNNTKIAVVGPHGNSIINLFGGYTFVSMLDALSNKDSGFSMLGVNEGIASAEKESGTIAVDSSELYIENFVEEYCREKYKIKTLFEQIKAKVDGGNVKYARGCNIDDDDRSMMDEAVRIAEEADVVIMTLGGKCGWSNDATSGEGRDRADLNLPGIQEELLKKVKNAGKPVVLLLLHGRPMSINWAASHIEAIIESWFPGLHGGQALADVIFGDYNPGGKLPVSVPRAAGQVPIYHDHKSGAGYRRNNGMLENLFGGGYTDIPTDPLYHFGYGLSYTKFEFSEFKLSSEEISVTGKLIVSTVIKNIGKRKGDEVVQFYIRDCEARVTRPVMELVGFKRVTLESGERKRVLMTLEMSQLGFLNEDMEFVVEPGNMEIFIGSSSNNIHYKTTFKIIGNKRRLEGKRTYLSEMSIEKC